MLDVGNTGIALPYTALLFLLTVKHFIADGPLQTSYQYINKGTFGHPGGIVHAGIHAAFTLATLVFWSKYFEIPLLPLMVIVLVLIDFTIHYLCDWSKVRITKLFNWSKMELDENGHPSYLKITSNNFFIALMADQTIHILTYVAIFYIIMKSSS
jgi:hypothetical protein